MLLLAFAFAFTDKAPPRSESDAEGRDICAGLIECVTVAVASSSRRTPGALIVLHGGRQRQGNMPPGQGVAKTAD